MLSAARTTFSLQKAAGLGAVAAGGYFATRAGENTVAGQSEGRFGTNISQGVLGAAYSYGESAVLNTALGGGLTARGGPGQDLKDMLTGGLGSTATAVGMGAGAAGGALVGGVAAYEGMMGFEAPRFSTQSAGRVSPQRYTGSGWWKSTSNLGRMFTGSRSSNLLNATPASKGGTAYAKAAAGNAASVGMKAFATTSIVLGGAALGAEVFGSFASKVAESVERAHGQLPADEEEMMPRRTRGSGAGAGVVTSGRRYAKPQVTGGMVHDLHKTGGTGGVLR